MTRHRLLPGGVAPAAAPLGPIFPLLLSALLPLGAGCARDPGSADLFAPPTTAAPTAVTYASDDRDEPHGLDLPGGCEPGMQWCVRLLPAADAAAVASDHGLVLGRQLQGFGLAVLHGSAELDELRGDPRVLVAERNLPAVLSDPLDLLMGFHQGDWDESATTSQEALAPLQLGEVHALALGTNVKIAVLDTGADFSHPHLVGHVLARSSPLCGTSRERANEQDDDGDGAVDEGFGHGTHVAGIIATIAPDATIFAVPVLNDDGVGTEFDLAAGLIIARAWGVDIVNLSLRLSGYSAIVAGAIADLCHDGAVVLVAAGNDPGDLSYPASDPNVVAIAATDAQDALAGFSASLGAALAGPGVHVESSYPRRSAAWASGTSMACAAATGSLALVASARGPVVPALALEVLEATALRLPEAYGVRNGRVSPLAGVEAMLSQPLDPDLEGAVSLRR